MHSHANSLCKKVRGIVGEINSRGGALHYWSGRGRSGKSPVSAPKKNVSGIRDPDLATDGEVSPAIIVKKRHTIFGTDERS